MPDNRDRSAIVAAAADWLIAHDRGMSDEEQAAFERWLAVDPRHAEGWREAQCAWKQLDRLPELTPLARRSRTSPQTRWMPTAIGVAATLVLVFFMREGTHPSQSPEMSQRVRLANHRVLTDGTLVKLKDDAEIIQNFSPTERKVRLVRGEVHFDVVHDRTRPFLVEVSGVVLRAVGTAFSVKLHHAAVEVLVTAGRVRVDPPTIKIVPPSVPSSASRGEPAAPSATPEIVAGHRAILGLVADRRVEITSVTSEQVAQALDWQSLRLQFHDMPLDKVAGEFNRYNRTQLIVDPLAADTIIAGSFRSDNVEVFVRFLEMGFRLSAERRADETIVLRPAH